MATLKEISEATGFSITTVSRVLSEDETFSVAESTRSAIFEAAEKLNYKSPSRRVEKNRQAKNLFKVGIVEMEYELDHFKDSYYIYMRNSVEKSLFDMKLEPIAFRYNEETAEYMNISGNVDGIIAIGQFSAAQVSAMEKWTRNIVFIDSSPATEKYTSVVPDYETGIRQGVEYLYKKGHRSIAFTGVKYTLDSRAGKIIESRRRIFDDVVKEYPELKACHIDTPSGSSGTSESIKKYFASTKKADRVTAFFTFNEPTAIGVLRAIEAEGFKVPKDYSVLSYNDTALATMTNPQLSGIHIPLPQIAEAAVFFLNRCMLKEADMPLKIMVPTTITERESVGDR